MANEFLIPNLPNLPGLGGGGGTSYGNAGYGDIMQMLQSIQGLPSLTSTLVPQVRDITGQASQYLMPQIAAIRDIGSSNVAAAQSDAMARGLTGSDIEAAGMLGARAEAGRQEAGLRGQFGLAQAQTMTNVLGQAMMGDLDAARQLRLALSQAMGEELTAKRDREMFDYAMQFGLSEAAANRRSAGMSGLLGGLGGVGGALVGGKLYPANPALGALVGLGAGKMAGSGIGGFGF